MSAKYKAMFGVSEILAMTNMMNSTMSVGEHAIITSATLNSLEQAAHTVSIIIHRNLTADVEKYSSLQDVKRALRNVVIPILCVVGILGNIINLVVLTRIRLRKADGGKDSGTHLGLIVLAVSDMIFCLAVFPRQFISETNSLFPRKDFWCFYQLYGTGIVTTFMLTSTWLTVCMASIRYVGICHPFCSRKIDGPRFTKIAYTLVFVFCIVLNLPSFWLFKLTDIELDGDVQYLMDIGYFDQRKTSGLVFNWLHIIFGIFIPMVIVTFCNTSLIQALRRSYKMRKQYHVQETTPNTSNRITLTLVIIIMAFVILVVPSEAMDFFFNFITLDPAKTEIFLLARAFANVLQIINFSFNFILYCIINVHFRGVLFEIMSCNGRIKMCAYKGRGGGISRNMSTITSTTSMLKKGAGHSIRLQLVNLKNNPQAHHFV